MNTKIVNIIRIASIIVLINISILGQTHITPKGVDLSTIESGVDLFSGGLNQSFPLFSVRGRGELSHTLYLKPQNVNWHLNEFNSYYDNSSNTTYHYYDVNYGEGYFNQMGQMTNSQSGYGSSGKIEIETKFQGYYYLTSVTFVKFVSNSGDIIEFRDLPTNGEPYNASERNCVRPPTAYPPPPAATCSRGKVFRSNDGSNVLFVSDTDIYDIIDQGFGVPGQPSHYSGGQYVKGTMYFPDGTKIRIGDDFNNVTSMTDRNGNIIDFIYEWVPHPDPNYPNGQFYRLTKIKDSLNREVSLIYGDYNQSTFYDEIVYKGFGGATKSIKIYYKSASEVHAPNQPVLSTTQLFNIQSIHQGNERHILGSQAPIIVPKVVSSIVLPDGKEYKFLYNSYFEVSRIISPLGSYVDYDYYGITESSSTGYLPPPMNFTYGLGSIRRRISGVKTYTNSGQLINETRFSNIPLLASTLYNGSPEVDNVTVDAKDSNGNTLTKTKHYFYLNLNSFYQIEEGWVARKEYKFEVLNPTNNSILRKI